MITYNLDVCIIGAGPAGICLGLGLSGSDLRVGVFEMGGVEYNPSLDAANVGSLEIRRESDAVLMSHPDYSRASRRNQIGGASNIWAHYIRPLDSIDFALRSWVEGSGWPISYEEMRQYYERAYALCGVAEPGNTPFSESIVHQLYFTRFPALSFSQHVNEFAENVRLIPNYRFTGFEAGIAYFATPAGDVRVQAKKFVFAMGGIENAKQATILGSKYAGRCLLEHMHFTGAKIHIPSMTLEEYDAQNYDFVTICPVSRAICLSEAVQAASKTLNGQMDIDILRSESKKAGHVVGHLRYICEHQPANLDCTLLGNNIRLIFTEQMQETFDVLCDYIESDYKAKIERWDEFKYPSIGHHAGMGSTRMGYQYNVVDRDCRFLDWDDLYFAGSSVFPTGGHAPPTLTIAALSLRLAEHLKDVLS